MGSFQVLVGPNASGKTTFLDVIGFLSDLVSEGLEPATGWRTRDFRDLVWGRSEGSLELAVEARIPEDRRRLLAVSDYNTVRYELALGLDSHSSEVRITAERGWLKVSNGAAQQKQKALFPSPTAPPASILTPSRQPRSRSLFAKVPGGNDNYYADAHDRDGAGPRRSN